MRKKRVKKPGVTMEQIKTVKEVAAEQAMRGDRLWKVLAEDENVRIGFLMDMMDSLTELEEKVQKQAEVIVRMGSYNPEKMQEANC